MVLLNNIWNDGRRCIGAVVSLLFCRCNIPTAPRITLKPEPVAVRITRIPPSLAPRMTLIPPSFAPLMTRIPPWIVPSAATLITRSAPLSILAGTISDIFVGLVVVVVTTRGGFCAPGLAVSMAS